MKISVLRRLFKVHKFYGQHGLADRTKLVYSHSPDDFLPRCWHLIISGKFALCLWEDDLIFDERHAAIQEVK